MSRTYGLIVWGHGDPVEEEVRGGADVFTVDADGLEAALIEAGVPYERLEATLGELGPLDGTPGALFRRKAVAEPQTPATAVIVEGSRNARTTR